MLAAESIMSNGLGSLSLQKKVSASLLAVMVAFGLVSYLILNAVITPAFEDLETKAAQTDLVRALRVILADLEQLNASNGDWAPWDDAHNYALGKNPNFIAINVDIPTLVNLDLNLMLFYDLEGHLLWDQFVQSGEGVDFAKLGVFEEGTALTRRLISHRNIDGVLSGLLQTNMGPLLISSMPILKTGNVGPIAGTIVMARFLDDSRIWRLSEQTEIEFAAYQINDPNIDMSRPLAALSSDDDINFYHETTDDAILSG